MCLIMQVVLLQSDVAYNQSNFIAFFVVRTSGHIIQHKLTFSFLPLRLKKKIWHEVLCVHGAS